MIQSKGKSNKYNAQKSAKQQNTWKPVVSRLSSFTFSSSPSPSLIQSLSSLTRTHRRGAPATVCCEHAVGGAGGHCAASAGRAAGDAARGDGALGVDHWPRIEEVVE